MLLRILVPALALSNGGYVRGIHCFLQQAQLNCGTARLCPTLPTLTTHWALTSYSLLDMHSSNLFTYAPSLLYHPNFNFSPSLSLNAHIVVFVSKALSRAAYLRTIFSRNHRLLLAYAAKDVPYFALLFRRLLLPRR